jgi:tRNA 2-thiouridine synthesizing protein D
VKFAIQINSAPWENQGCETAYQFSRAAIRMGHEIARIFFYYEGIYNGLRWMVPPEDEKPLIQRWSTLATEHGVDLVICISAAQRRGLLEQSESVRLGKLDDDLGLGFRIAGLGLWVDACLKADRFLVFGA